MLSEDFILYWGDAHTNLRTHFFNRFSDSFVAAKDLLDFWLIAYYPFDLEEVGGYLQETSRQRKRFIEQWDSLCRMTAKENDLGRFICFPGYEWHGDRRKWGDVNVFYPRDDVPLDDTETLGDLYEHIRSGNGIAIPHHTGYQLRERGKDWDVFDEKISPFVEIYSSHGSSEGYGSPRALDHNLSMGPFVEAGSVQEGLSRGLHFGIIASGDIHEGYPTEWGKGSMACYANNLTRKDLWEAFNARRVYGVTGDRIKLDFCVAGLQMGEIGRVQPPYRIQVKAEGCDAIARIELIRQGVVVRSASYQYDPNRNITGEGRYKFRCFFGWGPRVEKNPDISNREWDVKMSLDGGTLLNVEKLWMLFGQRIEQQTTRGCHFHLTSGPATQADHGRDKFPGMLFEVKGSPRTRIDFKINEKLYSFTLQEARHFPAVFAEYSVSERFLKERYGITPERLMAENYDLSTIWHNAYKTQFWPAVHEEEFSASAEWTDTPEGKGETWYYVRVIQNNGQVAWSSPVWITPEQ